MNEIEFHRLLAYGVMVTGLAVAIVLHFVTAPYGRHARKGWGPQISNRLGWMIMESPSAIGFAAIYCLGEHALQPIPLGLAALWLTHYFHRAYVFPFRMRSGKKPMPAVVSLMAIVFNCANAYLNARWISQFGTYEFTWNLVAGAALFTCGMVINIQSDNILFSLRKPGEEGYKIPYGGAYRWVSSPNYLGEIIEWGGWALASASLAGVSFFVFTCANLIPRALSHHAWFKRSFPNYPPERRAVLPFVL